MGDRRGGWLLWRVGEGEGVVGVGKKGGGAREGEGGVRGKRGKGREGVGGSRGDRV